MVDGLRLLYGVLLLVSGIASVCGNLVVLVLVLLHRDLQTDTLGLTLSFSISDLVLGLTTIAYGAHNSLVQPSGSGSGSESGSGSTIVCQGSGFLFLLLQTGSVHSLAWATADRFMEVCLALSYGSIWTVGRTRTVLILVWSFCLLTAGLPLLGFGSYSYSESRFLCCPSFTPDNGDFVVLWTWAGVLVPVLVTCGLYGSMVYVARKQTRRGTFMCNELHCYYVPANHYLRSSVVMVTTSVVLLVCWLPFMVGGLYETFSGKPLPSLTSALSAWLVLTHCAVNPWITCLTQTRYRAALRRSGGRFTETCPGTALRCCPLSSAPHPDSTNRISPPTALPPFITENPHSDATITTPTATRPETSSL